MIRWVQLMSALTRGRSNPDVLRPHTNSQTIADAIFQHTTATSHRLAVVRIRFDHKRRVPGLELPGGPIGMAIGAQRRNNGFDWKPSALYQSGDLYNGQQDDPANETRNVEAWFVENGISCAG